MRQYRVVLSLSVLVLSILACNAVSGLQQAQKEIPSMLTAAPTLLGFIGTAAAEFTPPAISTGLPGGSESVPGDGLGISLADVRLAMEATQQFTFEDGSVDGQPAMIARLTASAAAGLPGLEGDFLAVFMGDPENLSRIKITIPYSDDQSTVQAGFGLVTVLFASILPPDVLLRFLPWITENYSKVPVDGSQELIANNTKFSISKTQTEMLLDITSVK